MIGKLKGSDFKSSRKVSGTLVSGRGGSSSGIALDYGSRGPRLDSRWELGFFTLSSLHNHSISGASLIRSLMEVQHNWLSTFQDNIKSLAVQLEAKQA